jgi:hypothetical protein
MSRHSLPTCEKSGTAHKMAATVIKKCLIHQRSRVEQTVVTRTIFNIAKIPEYLFFCLINSHLIVHTL